MLTYIITSLMLSITPGPSVLYVMAFTLRYGALVGLVSAIGVNVGSYISISIAAFGTSWILAAYPDFFKLIKFLGALYIFYLAVKLWPKAIKKSSSSSDVIVDSSTEVTKLRVFKNGLITSLLNPKDILFYTSFVPNFIYIINMNISYTAKFLILSLTYAFIGLLTKSIFIISAGYLKKYVEHQNATYINYISSILLGILSLYFLLDLVSNK